MGGVWRTVTGPAGIDPALAATIEAAIRKAFDSEIFQKGMKERGFGAVWRTGGDDLETFLVEHDTMTTQVMQAVAGRN